MGLKAKVRIALEESFPSDKIVLNLDKDGMVGYIVSKLFRRKDFPIRRQMVFDALSTPEANISQAEQRKVKIIAGYTPEEFRERSPEDLVPEGGDD